MAGDHSCFGDDLCHCAYHTAKKRERMGERAWAVRQAHSREIDAQVRPFNPWSIKFTKLRPDAIAPMRASEYAAGFDLAWCPTPEDRGRYERNYSKPWILETHDNWATPHSITLATGIAFAIPPGTVGLMFSRSGHGFKNNVRLANCVGVIDADFRGEILAKLTADKHGHLTLKPGDRIAQIVFVGHETVLEEVSELSVTARGTSGFGSTGR